LDGGSASRKASTYTGQHNAEKHRHTCMLRAGFETTIPVFERLKRVRAPYCGAMMYIYCRHKSTAAHLIVLLKSDCTRLSISIAITEYRRLTNSTKNCHLL